MPSRRVSRTRNSSQDRFDEEMMRRAIILARKGEGRVEPNPMVGCVVTRRSQIIGQGYHRRFGGPHAEIHALCSCKQNPKRATVYVSLEPCCHHGNTPPCTEALIRAGVIRVVIAVRDANPTVNNRGIRQLRQAGINVQIGLLANESAGVLAPYLTRIRLNRPYVIAKWAQSLDGKIAMPFGQTRWISCETSRKKVHRLRARVDAVLVGITTVLKDHPLLTARGVSIKRKATRVVLDTRLRIMETCQLVTTSRKTPTIVFTASRQTQSRKAHRLRKRGVDVVSCRVRGNRLMIGEVIKKLHHRDMTNILVEGGAAVLSSFFQADLIDEAWIFTAPILIGDDKAPMINIGGKSRNISQALHPVRCQTRKSGSDTFHRMWFKNL